MFLRLWFTALALVLASPSLKAQSQSEMNREAAEEADAADMELNQVSRHRDAGRLMAARPVTRAKQTPPIIHRCGAA